MVTLWRIPDDYPEEAIGKYDRAVSMDRSLFREGKRIDLPADKPVVRFSVPVQELTTYDCLLNDSMVPLIGRRLVEHLQELCASDFQSLPALVIAKNGQIEDFSILNVVSAVRGIDHPASEYSFVPGTKQIMGFRRLRYDPECLGKHHLARDAEYRSHLLASADVERLFRELAVKGAVL